MATEGGEPGHSIRVMLLDDSEDDFRLARRMLSRAPEPFELSWEPDVEAALEQMARNAFDAYVVDYRLGEHDGVGVVADARARGCTRPLVLFTHYGDDDVAAAAMLAGASDYVDKEHTALLARSIRYAIERQRLDVLRQQLQATEHLASLGNLAAGIAREVSGPATYVLANLHLVADLLARLVDKRKAPSELREMQALVGESVAGMDRIRLITEALGAYAAVRDEDVEQVDLNAVVGTATAMVAPLAREHAKLVVRHGALAKIPGQRIRLAQLFTNLLLNAIDAVAEAPADDHRIEITSERSADALVVRVVDTGVGIPDALRERVFERFFTTKRSGAGLGLPICREIANQHGGKIGVAAGEDGLGAVFEVRLPLHNGLRVTAQAPPSSRSRPERRSRVLVVDDDPTVARSYARVLSARHDVVTAGGGEEALAMLERDTRFDAVVCDLMMPRVSGIDVYRKVAELTPLLCNRFLFSSGGAFTPEVRQFIESVDNLLLLKPSPPDALLRAVSRVAAKPLSDR